MGTFKEAESEQRQPTPCSTGQNAIWQLIFISKPRAAGPSVELLLRLDLCSAQFHKPGVSFPTTRLYCLSKIACFISTYLKNTRSHRSRLSHRQAAALPWIDEVSACSDWLKPQLHTQFLCWQEMVFGLLATLMKNVNCITHVSAQSSCNKPPREQSFIEIKRTFPKLSANFQSTGSMLF